MFIDTVSDVAVKDYFECTSPCSGKALCRDATVMWDAFHKSLVKKRIDQNTIA